VDGNASRLIPVLSECGIPVVITTGADVDLGHPALSKAAVVLQKPHANSDLVEAIVECVVVAPSDKGSPWSPSERATAFSKQLLRWSQWKFLSEKHPQALVVDRLRAGEKLSHRSSNNVFLIQTFSFWRRFP
jgi:hypothetical protein